MMVVMTVMAAALHLVATLTDSRSFVKPESPRSAMPSNLR